jgi:hypothetical protein
MLAAQNASAQYPRVRPTLQRPLVPTRAHAHRYTTTAPISCRTYLLALATLDITESSLHWTRCAHDSKLACMHTRPQTQ